MINQCSALCAGRSTIVVVVVLLGTFITFDSYTSRLFSTLSKSVAPDFFTSSGKEKQQLDSTASWATEAGSKGVGQEGEGVTTHSQVSEPVANEPSKEDVKALSQGSEFRGENSESSSKALVSRNGDLRKQPQAGNNLTRVFTNISEAHESTDRRTSKGGGPPEKDQTRRYFDRGSETYDHPSKDAESLNGNDPQRTGNHTPGSQVHTVEDTGSVNEGCRESASTIAGKTSVSELTGIQKVELDLRQARATLKRVSSTKNRNAGNGEGSDRHVHGEPRGEAFKNAALFRQSYQEMESRLKVYIYQEGEEPLVHDGPCKEIYSVEGRFIQELHDNNPFVTSDPEEAHVFFLPFSVAMMVTYLYKQNSGDMSPLLRFVQDYVHVIADKYPYWNRSDGADHFMLSCHDWGPYVTEVDNNLYTKSIRVLCNANTSEGFVPYKDASLPEINLVGGVVPTALGGLPISARTYLAFFAGADHGPVRPLLFEHFEGKDPEILVHHQVPVGGLTYHEYMKSSKFCICPGGYEVNSPRVVEAIYNDCIPVIIADKFVLPFSDVLDWSKFSLQVLEEDIPKLKSILKAVPVETLTGMQNRLKQVRKHFLLNQPPERYDVFNMILHSVWLRRLNIRVLG